MGQQQILLVLLVTIIVGVATIIAINVITKRADLSNRESVRQDLASAAAFVQSVWERPEVMGGASKKFSNLEESEILRFLNVPSSEYNEGDPEAVNENGSYTVEIVSDTELTVTGVPVSGPPNLQVTVSRDDGTNQWTFEFSEVGEDDLGGGGGGGPQRGTDGQRQGRF